MTAFGTFFVPGPTEVRPVSVVSLPDGVTGDAVVRAVGERGFTVAGGYGKLTARTFRIGHMGDHSADGLQRCLDACSDALASLGVPVGS